MSMIEGSSGSLYADLGHADADTMQAKAQMVAAMLQTIEEQRLSFDCAARLAGITQDELKTILAGQFRGLPLSALEHMQKEIHRCTET